MTRKHFDAVADVLFEINRRNHESDDWEEEAAQADRVLRQVAEGLANKFKDFNPNFNKAKFYAACALPREESEE